MVDYFREKGRLPEAPDGNWRLVPTAAVGDARPRGGLGPLSPPRSPGTGARGAQRPSAFFPAARTSRIASTS